MSTELTPYDTGLRAEPRVWLSRSAKVSEATPTESFGKVDFEDDAGEALCTVYVERNPDGSHTVHVQSLCDASELTTELHPDE